MTGRRPEAARLAVIVRYAGWLTAAALALVAALGTALALAGPLGLVVTADVLAVLALARILLKVPRRAAPGEQPPPELPGHHRVDRAADGRTGRIQAALRRAWRGYHDHSGVAAADFPVYLRVSSDLAWAKVSWWHYDHGTRRLLTRLLTLVLTEGHRLDPAADPERAAALVGTDLWPLVDPARPVSQDTHTPGPGLDTLARLTDVLEKL
jgi:hypothetical protein